MKHKQQKQQSFYSPTKSIMIDRKYIKHLNNEQFKVVGAIIAYFQNQNTKNKQFPSNEAIAFFCGFNDTQIVKRTKESLIEIGLLKQDMTINQNWAQL